MKYKMPVLETERLILKRGTLEDYQKVFEYDFSKLRNIAGEFELAPYPNPELLKIYAKDYDNEENILDYTLFLKGTNEPIGNIVFDRYNKELNSLEIACNLHPNYWGKGYMKEATLKIMDYVYKNLNIDNIVYGYAEENFKSKSLCNKIGFKYKESKIVHYDNIDKDIKEIFTVMNKEDFYKNNKRR